MKLIGSNNQARDDYDKVIEVLANINGYLVFLMNSRYTVILRRSTPCLTKDGIKPVLILEF